MADVMDMSWLVRDMNDRAVEEVRIQHVFTPGLPEEIRTEKMKKRKFAKAEMHIPFYFILDIFYIWASFLSVSVSLIYFLMFLTMLGWTPSIQSFTYNATTRVGQADHSHDMLEPNGYRMRVWCGYYLFVSVILFVVSWISFFGAGISGKRRSYIISLVNHGLIMLTEAFAVYYAFNHLPPTCDTTVFRTHMLKLFRWYGILNPHINNHGIEAMDKIHELQASLSCCGVDGYKDYEKIFSTQGDPAYDPSWYPPTIHVLETYHIKDLDYYIEYGRESPWTLKIGYPQGCVSVVKETCERLVYLMTYGMLAVLILRCLLWLIMLVVGAISLRAMSLVMTTLFSVTRGNVRFIYDYRKTHPDDDPYKKAIGDFRRGIRPEGWEEYAQKRVEGRKKTHLITEEFTVGDLASHVEEDDKVYKEIIRKWKVPENEMGPIYFGVEPPPGMTEKDYLAIRGQEKVRVQENNMLARLAKMGVDERRQEAERIDKGAKRQGRRKQKPKEEASAGGSDSEISRDRIGSSPDLLKVQKQDEKEEPPAQDMKGDIGTWQRKEISEKDKQEPPTKAKPKKQPDILESSESEEAGTPRKPRRKQPAAVLESSADSELEVKPVRAKKTKSKRPVPKGEVEETGKSRKPKRPPRTDPRDEKRLLEMTAIEEQGRKARERLGAAYEGDQGPVKPAQLRHGRKREDKVPKIPKNADESIASGKAASIKAKKRKEVVLIPEEETGTRKPHHRSGNDGSAAAEPKRKNFNQATKEESKPRLGEQLIPNKGNKSEKKVSRSHRKLPPFKV